MGVGQLTRLLVALSGWLGWCIATRQSDSSRSGKYYLSILSAIFHQTKIAIAA